MYFWKIFYQIFKGKTFYKFVYIFPTNKYLKMEKTVFEKYFTLKQIELNYKNIHLRFQL